MTESNRSSTLSFSLPPSPDDSRSVSSMSMYSNTSSIYQQQQQKQQYLYGNMNYDQNRFSFVGHGLQQQHSRHLYSNATEYPHHNNNNNNSDSTVDSQLHQYEVVDDLNNEQQQQQPADEQRVIMNMNGTNNVTTLQHKPSSATIASNFTANLRTQQQHHLNLRKHATTRGIQQQQYNNNIHRQSFHAVKPMAHLAKQKTLPLFPTIRTRGSSSVQDALRPVDISQINLMPIEFSHKIIMNCIDEIKLRGLKHKHLFRNAFYSPSVESALATMINAKRRKDVFSVKMMRMDTVGGLLTTALSRTYPPLIPHHVRELFENPKGRFFFELLGLLPELNRFLFVEILDLCCDLVDNQSFNHVSHSKLAIYPGSCCFGMDEFMPTWDSRYLLTTDVKKFSTAFYQVIYAYREERDLSAEQLQQKLDDRDAQMERDRLEALEREHGLVGMHEILKRETRLARGLPMDSPVIPPSDVREISLYADRKEIVVADDAISVFEMRLDGDDDEDAVVPKYAKTRTRTTASATSTTTTTLSSKAKARAGDDGEEEDIETVIRDLGKSVSVAEMGKPDSTKQYRASLAYRLYAVSTRAHQRTARPTPQRTKSLARFTSIHQNLFPVSPGDIFGISRHAIQRRELQVFMAVARTASAKKRKAVSSKKLVQLRTQNRLLRRHSRNRSKGTTNLATIQHMKLRGLNCQQIPVPHNLQQQLQHQQPQQLPLVASCSPVLPTMRRGRNRQLRKELEVYLAKGLSPEEAAKEREVDIKREKRQAKKVTKKAAKRVMEAEEARQRALLIQEEKEAAVRAIAETRAQGSQAQASEKSKEAAEDEVTMEEAEILEAFDYLSDEEFAEFMTLAGLSMADVNRLRAKSAAAALHQLTKQIQQSVPAPATAMAPVTVPAMAQGATAAAAATAPKAAVIPPATAASTTSTIVGAEKRPFNLPHMTSMDLLMKNASVIGDSNLRCYPTSPAIVPRSELLFTVPVIEEHYEDVEEKDEGEDEDEGEDDDDDDDYMSATSTADTTTESSTATSTAVQSSESLVMLEVSSSSSSVVSSTTSLGFVLNEKIESKQEQEPETKAKAKAMYAFETIVYEVEEEEVIEYDEWNEDEDDEVAEDDEEAEELRELLKSMSVEERTEFLRLSRPGIEATEIATLVQAA
ncbi:hypothetical protein BG004_008457 [Podila humilis]|nr:hypothetical protein BG004_008457 [Podila humilis]